MSDALSIDLAQCPNFAVGSVALRPSTREVEHAGRIATIEPRVMQLLVVLGRAAGAVVSRDTIIEQCWGGRAISEDALNRTIAKARLVASDIADGGFEIETIVKVGYRLVLGKVIEQVAHPAVPHVGTDSLAWAPVVLFSSILVALAGALVFSISSLGKRAATGPPTSPIVAAAADLETRGLSAIFEGTPERTAEGIDYLRQATAADPKRAELWGSLAMGCVLSLPHMPAPDQSAVIERVREAAARAQSLDKTEGRSAAALVSLMPTYGNWTAKDKAVTYAIARAPRKTAPLMFQRVLFLASVGRTREALALARELNAISPYLPWIKSALANLLVANGNPDEAEKVAENASKLWPRERLTWYTRFYLYTFGGQPKRALAMAADLDQRPDQSDPRELELAILTAKAMVSTSASDVDRVIAHLNLLSKESAAFRQQAVRSATALGRPADAIRFATMLLSTPDGSGARGLLMPNIGATNENERNLTPLFFLPTREIWKDSKFLAKIERSGIAAYWRQTMPPDFCKHGDAAYTCSSIKLGRRRPTGIERTTYQKA